MNESDCKCLECEQIRLASLNWDSYVPVTNLQKRMLEVVKRIEDREIKKTKIKKKISKE